MRRLGMIILLVAATAAATAPAAPALPVSCDPLFVGNLDQQLLGPTFELLDDSATGCGASAGGVTVQLSRCDTQYTEYYDRHDCSATVSGPLVAILDACDTTYTHAYGSTGTESECRQQTLVWGNGTTSHCWTNSSTNFNDETCVSSTTARMGAARFEESCSRTTATGQNCTQRVRTPGNVSEITCSGHKSITDGQFARRQRCSIRVASQTITTPLA